MTAASAGTALLAALRDARHRDQDSIHSLQLEAFDGTVGLSIPVAIAMSPVLATALSGQFVESRRRTYALKSHSVNILNFAIDYMCGDVRRQITGNNAMELLALADELSMESLRVGCEDALLAIVTTSNAAQLEEAATRYRCEALQEAASALVRAESSVIGDLMNERQRLRAKRAASIALEQDAHEETAAIDSKLSGVSDKLSHELEVVFRETVGRDGSAAAGDDYPHPVDARTPIHFVEPNATYTNWFYDDEPPAKKKPKGLKKRQRADGNSSSTASPIVHGSLMEAYEAAAPGSIIKLRAGRHAITADNAEGKTLWDELVYKKSVQIVADDGLGRGDVLVGIDASEVG